MNCKPGDLAVIIWTKAYPENIGALVRVVRESPNGPNPVHGFQWSCEALHPVRSSRGVMQPGQEGAMPDKFLRPIRDNDGEDETLTWAAKPQEVKHAVQA
jgi:hypothetical protein